MKNSEGRWEIFDDYVLDFALEQMRNGVRTAIVTLVEVDGKVMPRAPETCTR